MKRGMTARVWTVLVLLSLGAAAQAGVPTEQLKNATDRVLKLVQDPELRKPDKAEVRRRQIRLVADEIFDWREAGKRALARHWQPLSAAQRQEFGSLFADLVERAYVGKIEAYSGEKIAYAGDTVEGDEATVRTRLVTKTNTEIPIDYRLLKEGDRWRAYDVLIEGVSLVGNYRTQFNKIIAQSGYEELVRKMKAKQQELAFDQRPSGRPTTP